MNIDSEVSGLGANSYLSIAEADEMIQAFPPKIEDKWNELDEGDDAQLLIEASRMVDGYRGENGDNAGWAPPKVSGQALAFPRVCDDGIPAEVKTAVMEYVAYRLDGRKVQIKEAQEEGVTSAGIMGQSMALGTDKSGMPAGARRQLNRLADRYWPKATENRKTDGCDQPFFG